MPDRTHIDTVRLCGYQNAAQTLHGALSSPKMSEGIPGGEFIHRADSSAADGASLKWQTLLGSFIP
jgi:hypothetical protein